MIPEPFPHIVIPNWYDPETLRQAADEFPPPTSLCWGRFDNSHERKLACEDPTYFGVHTRFVLDYMQSDTMRVWLELMFDIDTLRPGLLGGGMHYIEPGGFLDVHVDFNAAGPLGYRRINTLLYLNESWGDEGGELVLGNPPAREIKPELGTLVAFATSDHSWHGHPTPTKRPRKSLAVYWYADEPYTGYVESHSTIFV